MWSTNAWRGRTRILRENVMPESDLLAADTAVTSQPCVVSCWKCGEKFDASSSYWCSCNAKMRTLRCPHCRSCFCGAPFLYRMRFWNDAPRALRENTHRFDISSATGSMQDGAENRRPTALSPDRPRVLIIDDEEPIRSLAAVYVRQMGYVAVTTSNPEEALLMISDGSFAVVLTDALMPKMDGRELCRTLKDAYGDRIKVILMTSLYTAARFRSEARHVFKVDEHLAKPIRYEELRDALQRVAPVAAA